MTAPLPGWPATTAPIAVQALDCGHITGDVHDDSCAYWAGVTRGEYAAPDLTAGTVVLPPHAPGLLPLTDPALRGRAA